MIVGRTEQIDVGFLKSKAAESVGARTLASYEQHLKYWLDFAGDVEVGQITAPDIRKYLAWLRTDYKPHRFTGNDKPLSPKTIRNFWVSLSAFFSWASIEFG